MLTFLRVVKPSSSYAGFQSPSLAVAFSFLTTITTAATSPVMMQTALHRQLPPMLPQYLPQSLTLSAGSRAIPNPTVMPTPPVTSRKRKRAHQYTVSYSEVQEVDEEGRVREVIVIEDTPPPPSTISPATTHTNVFSTSYQPPVYSAPIRTRARAAAELSASTSSAAIVAPAPKKRKREPADDSRGILTKKTAATLQQQPVASTKSWASGSGTATADVRNLLLSSVVPAHTHVFPLITDFQWQHSL